MNVVDRLREMRKDAKKLREDLFAQQDFSTAIVVCDVEELLQEAVATAQNS